jgi:hypothetical protein
MSRLKDPLFLQGYFFGVASVMLVIILYHSLSIIIKG